MLGDFSLQGAIVAITGGGSGIGFAFVKQCLDRGARVVIGDLRLTPEAQRLVDEKKLSKTCAFTKCDVTKWRELQNLIEFAQQEFGDVPDVYCACAGLLEPPFSNFWNDSEQDDHYASIAVNVEHPIKFTRMAIRAILGKNKKGVVLIVASIAGFHGMYPAPMYCASKHAVIGFTRSMGPAEELEGVKVVAICPHIVNTSMWAARPPTMASMAVTGLDPNDVANSMVDLVERGKYTGGTVFKHSMEETGVVAEDPLRPGHARAT